MSDIFTLQFFFSWSNLAKKPILLLDIISLEFKKKEYSKEYHSMNFVIFRFSFLIKIYGLCCDRRISPSTGKTHYIYKHVVNTAHMYTLL